MKKTLLCFLFLFTNFFYAQLSYVSICSGESFNLTSQNSVFIGSLDSATPVTYFLNQDDAFNNTNEITNPTNYYGAVGTTKIYGRIDDGSNIIVNFFNLNVFQSLTVTASHIPISCKGDFSSLTVNVAPESTYYYSLNGGAFTTNKIFNNLPAGVYNIKVQSPNPVCPDATLSYTITEPTPITAISTTSGQTVTVTAAGGTAPYQYSKDGTTYQNSTVFSGLAPGNYNFRVRDSRGCLYVMPLITIVYQSTLAATATITKQLDCISGATIVANATGGQAPYIYSINGGATYQTSNTFSNILPGSFTIRVKDAANTISASNSVIVTPPAAINVNTFVTLPDCINNTATITISATGGQAPYSYSKDNGVTYTTSSVFSNVLPGTYKIRVKDSKSCISPSLNTIIQSYSPLNLIASSALISCNAGVSSLTVNATGGMSPYQYSINNGVYTTSNTYSGLSAGTYTIKVKDALGCVSSVDHTINQPADLIVSLSTSGSKITVTASGGTAPYQYSLDGNAFQTSNVLTALTSGNYLVQARDSQGCSKTFVVAIVAPDPLTSLATITREADCINGASIAVDVFGGQAPYFYSIDGGMTYQTVNSFTNISAGVYTVKVKDIANTIANSNSIIVRAPSPVNATTLVTSTDCSNKATIKVQAIGGQAPYLYSLNGGAYTSGNTFYNVSPGTYIISVKDSGGCASSVVITTVEPVVPLSVTGSNTAILCNGETASLTISVTGGKAPYEYSINNGAYGSSNTFTDLNAGTYVIKVRDAIGCSSEILHVITEPTSLTATSVTFGQNIVITTNGGNSPYQYSLDGVNYQDSNVFLDATSGTYPVTIKDSKDCSFTLLVKLEPSEQPLSSGVMTVKAVDCRGNGALRVIGYGGQPPYEYSIDGGLTFQTSDTFNDLIAGIYPVAVRDTQNTVVSNLSMELSLFIPVTGSTIVTNTSGCINNGIIEISANGGQIPHYYSIDGGKSYSADNTFSNLPAGDYTIFVKDSQDCISPVISATILAPSTLSVTATSTSILCNGDSASLTISATGGQAPYLYAINNDTYSSSNTFTSLNSGTYIIKVKDAFGCSSELEYLLTQPSALSATVDAEGQTATIHALGGTSPYQYSVDQVNFLDNNIFTNLSPGQHTIFLKDINGCESAPLNVTIADPTPLTSTAAITKSLDCISNATITITTVGGQAPYTYSIDGGITYQVNNDFSNLTAGTYNAVVKDAANTISTANTIVINPLVPLVATLAIPRPLDCNGIASIAATATGGIAPYKYAMNDGVYSSINIFYVYVAGNYTINIKDSAGCVVQKVITIAPYSPISISNMITNVTCPGGNNGSIRVLASSGVSPYTYSIGTGYQASNLFTNLVAGNYVVSVKDKQGCVRVLSAVITQPSALAITTATTNAICSSSATGTITINVSGGTSPYRYSIDGINYLSNKTFSSLTAGVYNLSVKDNNGCTASSSATITQPDPLLINLTKTDSNCYGSQDGTITTTVNGGTAPYSYSLNNGAYTSSNVFRNLTVGQYNIKAKDAGGCTTTTSTITIVQPTPLITVANVTNPTSSNNSDGRITVTASGGVQPYFYSLKNSNGTIIIQQQSFNIFTNLISGSYIVQVTDARGCTFSQQVNVVSPPSLVATTNVTTPLTCNSNGVITVTATGGTAPYQYSFDNGTTYTSSNVFTAATPGTYAIKVRDYQYNTTSLAAVIDPVNPLQLMAIIMSPVTCSQNGVITAIVNGGRAPFVYSLNGAPFQSTNTFNVSAGTHIIVVKDSYGCTSISAVDMTAPQPLVASLVVDNQTVTITATDGSGSYRYAISPDLNLFTTNNTFINLEAGDYTAIVQDLSGCYVMLNFEISLPAPLMEGKEQVTVDFNPGQTLGDLVVKGQNIKWYSTQNPVSGKTSKSAETSLPLSTILVDGTAYYASQTINGIESKERLAVTAKLNSSLATPDFALPNFSYYPNPVQHTLSIRNTSNIDEVEVFSVSGKSILSQKVNNTHSEIDLSNVSSGFYFLKVKSEGKIKTIKIVKK